MIDFARCGNGHTINPERIERKLEHGMPFNITCKGVTSYLDIEFRKGKSQNFVAELREDNNKNLECIVAKDTYWKACSFDESSNRSMLTVQMVALSDDFAGDFICKDNFSIVSIENVDIYGIIHL